MTCKCSETCVCYFIDSFMHVHPEFAYGDVLAAVNQLIKADLYEFIGDPHDITSVMRILRRGKASCD